MPKIERDRPDTQALFDPTELGETLRESRQALQRDIAEVAQELRIRRPYLEALEDGRLEDLPGPAYTTGFLRVYSDYLGLDSEDIVNRFKQAGIDIDRRTNLTLPSPLEEGRLPTGSILLVGAVFAAIVYAGWYYVSTDDSVTMDQIASVPKDLVSGGSSGSSTAAPTNISTEIEKATAEASKDETVKTDGALTAGAERQPAAAAPSPIPTPIQPSKTPETTATTASTASTPPVAPVPSSTDTTTTPDAAQPDSPANAIATARAVTVDAAPNVNPPVIASARNSQQADRRREDVSAAEVVARKSAVDVTTTTAPPAIALNKETNPPVQATTQATPAQNKPAPAQVATGDGSAKVKTPSELPEREVSVRRVVPPPATDSAATTDIAPAAGSPSGAAMKITVVAMADSWIEIRAVDGETLVSRLMRQGETFELKSRPGLKLVTGNAGGVQFKVDGKTVPPLGPSGKILKGVAIDAKSLLSRVN